MSTEINKKLDNFDCKNYAVLAIFEDDKTLVIDFFPSLGRGANTKSLIATAKLTFDESLQGGLFTFSFNK